MLSKQLNKNHYGRVCQSRLIPGEGPRYFTHNIYVLDLKGNIIAQPKQSNKIISIERWTYPFHIYFSTYVAVHLVRTQQLIKYIHDIHLDAQFNSTNNFGCNGTQPFSLPVPVCVCTSVP